MALTDSLLHWWDCDEISGPTVDQHGSIDMSWHGNVTYRAGLNGNALDIPGGNGDRLSGSDPDPGTGSFSVNFWAYIDSADYQTLLGTNHGDGAGFSFWDRHGNDFRFRVGDGSQEIIAKQGTTDYNAWHMATGVLDRAAGEIRLYLDGVLIEATSYSSLGSLTSSNGMKWGRRADSWTHWYDGGLDSVGMWDRALTDSEITDLYNSGNGVTYSDLTSSTTTYTLSGTVTDDGGSAIDGATVTWELSDGTQLGQTTTDSSGNYSLSAEIADSSLPDTTDVTASDPDYVDQLKQRTVDTTSTSYTADFSLNPAADTVAVGLGTALADAFEPTVSATPNTVAPGLAQASAEGFEPAVSPSPNTIGVGTAQAAANAYDPTVTQEANAISPTTGQAGAEGFDPTISESAVGESVTVGLASAQAGGHDPKVTPGPETVEVAMTAATAEGFDPTVTADPSEILTDGAQAQAEGFDPDVSPSPRSISLGTGQAKAKGFEPAVVDARVGVPVRMEIKARPKYETDTDASPLYDIELDATFLYEIELDAEPQLK